MRLPPRHIQNETSRINEDTRSYRAAKERLGMVAVCLVGPVEIVPRKLGDNRGAMPVRVVVTAGRPEKAAKDLDLAQPFVPWATLEHVMVDTREHGERLKAALETMLIGAQTEQDNDQPRHNFRDVVGVFDCDISRAMWWGEMVAAAQAECLKMAREFRVHTAEQAKVRIAASARSFGRRR